MGWFTSPAVTKECAGIAGVIILLFVCDLYVKLLILHRWIDKSSREFDKV